MEQNAWLRNVIQYDANNNYLSTIRHEFLYAAYILTEKTKPTRIKFRGKNIQELPESIELFNQLDLGVEIEDNQYTYGVCLFNKWCGFKTVKINETVTKKQNQLISDLIYKDSENSEEYNNRLSELEKKLGFFITTTNHIPSLNIEEMVGLVRDSNHDLLQKLPTGNVYLCQHLIMGLIDRCLDEFNKNSSLYKLFKSGSRFNKTQLAKSAIVSGLSADETNIVNPDPVRSSLLEGFTEEEFFKGAPGSRKGIVDKESGVPISGYIERSLCMAMSALEIVEKDCHCSNGLPITVLNKGHFNILIGKYYKLNLEDEWKLISESDTHLINQEIILRSVMTCQTPNFHVCEKCFGEYKRRTNYIGITAGQFSAERITQLLMRSFHTSGSADLELNQTVVNFIRDHLVDINTKDEKIIIKFSSDIPEEFKTLPGYIDNKNNEIIFQTISDNVKNQDTVNLMENIKVLLKKDEKPTMTPSEYYLKMVEALLTVGTIYSSYIECIFSLMFMVSSNDFWRYHQDQEIIVKLSDKTIAAKTSSLLGFLYQPNKITINELDNDDLMNKLSNAQNLSFHEKIFLNQL